MEKGNIFFISHSSKDNDSALELYKLLLEINPEWEGKIFLDCCEEKPLENHEEWRSRMLKEVENSRHLIFITSCIDYVKEGNGWLFEEVSHFQNLKANRNNLKRENFNVSYFGIFLCECDFENSLFNDELRGSEYRRLYQRPEHLVLKNEKSISNARERIKDKVNQLVAQNNSDETATLLLDKTRIFAQKKAKNDYMFSEGSIDENLVPLVCDGKGKLNFNEFSHAVQDNHTVLLGSEGGCGKTTVLTKLYYDYLKRADIANVQSMIPLYVDAKSLDAENHLILRCLAKNLFDEHTAMTDRSTSQNVGLFDYEFAIKRKTPRYLLIIDGYNEIPDGSIKEFERELKEFLPDGRYTNVRLVISGRNVGNNLPERVFKQFSINPLEGSAVSNYLKTKGFWKGKIKESLFRILSIPMYLKMYVETSADDKIQNKADLLCAFVAWQQMKDVASAEDEEKKALYQVLLKHLLPVIAYRMLMNNVGDSSFVLSEDELEKTLVGVTELLCESSYKKFYGREYREQLRTSDFSEYDELDLSDLSMEYFVRVCKILRQDDDGNLDFIHQIYRDFFCAWFIAEHMKRSNEKEESCSSLMQKRIDEDVKEFIVELLAEEKPVWNSVECVWDYSCNTKSQIISQLDIIRGEQGEKYAVSVANIIEMLKYARDNDLSGLDFSKLNLTESILRGCLFYRYDKEKSYPTSFADSEINSNNLFAENHSSEIIAACTNEKCVACIDATGVIKFWERKRVVNYPIKIITDVRYSIDKMLFGPQNDKIFAMTAHEILEIAIPEEFSSKAEMKIIFKTAKRLRDFVINESGEILFTTNLNSFNYKAIYNPDAVDAHKFYGVNSGACVLNGGRRVAFGHIAGYEGLKIYDYFEDSGEWKERRFGYAAILNDFIIELEEFLKKEKLYQLFPTDNEGYDIRRTYFSYIQQQFEDCTHHHYRIPRIIVKRCRERIEEKGQKTIKLNSSQNKELDSIVNNYEGILKKASSNNGLLMLLAGRKITGISTGKDDNTILVSCTVDYAEKLKRTIEEIHRRNGKQYDTFVLEINTETFETRFVTRFVADDVLRASYCGEDILVLSKYHFTVFDKNGSDIVHVTTCPKTIQKFLVPEDGDTVYAISQHFIYEMDKNLRCVKSMANVLGSTLLSCYVDSDGERVLAKRSAFKDADSSQLAPVINLSNGRYYEIDGSKIMSKVNCGDVLGENIKFKYCDDKLVLFENDVKTDEMDVPYKLFVCGCDFTNVSGDILEPRYMRMLYRMGAITDMVELPIVMVKASEESFTPSEEVFAPPEEIQGKSVPHSLSPGMTLEADCYFNDTVGGNHLFIQKTWELINKGSYLSNGIEGADYGILEWVDQLGFAYSGMINDLIEAGIIERPTRFRDAGKRMAGPLHRTFKVLYRNRFCLNGVGKNVPVYTVNFLYGKKLLQHITNKKGGNFSNKTRMKDIRRKLALNQWFTSTVRRHKTLVTDYSLDTIFDTENHFRGRANIHGYVQLGEQSFFAQAFRSNGDGQVDASIADKVHRMCILAVYYRSLIRYGKQINSLTKQPIIVLIGEDFEQCEMLYKQVRYIYPNVRKLFTYDTLLTSNTAFDGVGNYFEFVDGVPYSVKLGDLI